MPLTKYHTNQHKYHQPGAKVFFKLANAVSPETTVNRPKAKMRINVKMQDKSNGQTNVIPYFAPVEAAVVTLPVPMLYPTKNIPGPNEAKSKPSFLSFPGLSIIPTF
jgi:hypothetical protein